jgi:hypothetical protein
MKFVTISLAASFGAAAWELHGGNGKRARGTGYRHQHPGRQEVLLTAKADFASWFEEQSNI